MVETNLTGSNLPGTNSETPTQETPVSETCAEQIGRSKSSVGTESGEPRCAETRRLAEDAARTRNWKRWGPYLAERQWGTVREDYSHDGESWDFLSHDQSRSRAYRWGEDGLLGICDRQGRLCFALSLWNEKDPYLKERLFGLTGPQGNHGEDVKEHYFYIDSTPTHSYMKALYKYPQRAFPYQKLLDENATRSKTDREYELVDTGVFDDDRYFDVFAEYAKADANDILIRVTVHNRGPDAAPIHVLPTLWYRNTWSHGRSGEGYWPRPSIRRAGDRRFFVDHASLGNYHFLASLDPENLEPQMLLTENETNRERLYGAPNEHAHVKDAFHDFVVQGMSTKVRTDGSGTKAAVHYQTIIPSDSSIELRFRLFQSSGVPSEKLRCEQMLGNEFEATFAARVNECNSFHARHIPKLLNEEERSVARQAYAGLLWSKQFYNYCVRDWIEGDPNTPAPPDTRRNGRNAEWQHLYNRDVISMPDKWEYPWYAAWDLAFHMVPFAKIDPQFAKDQLLLFVREWYMHPNGQIPAYEFGFGDVNPPVHAWAAWRVYKQTGERGERDRGFLARMFHKLLLNFTWWINRKDREGNHIFSGGFLGLDNIGLFDRSQESPFGGQLDQADATGWMAFYCATMLSIALELATEDPVYEDVASKFFEHFVAIADAINKFRGTGLWDEEDGFYYDHLRRDGGPLPLKIRSMVGLIPFMVVEVLDQKVIDRLPGFKKRMRWFLDHRQDLAEQISYMDKQDEGSQLLLAIPSKNRLKRVLNYLLDETEFLSPHGIRSLSRIHKDQPYAFQTIDREYRVQYVAGESDSYMFGGNSNWRGPIWFPLNYLIVEALERYHLFYGDAFQVECPVGSGRMMTLREVACEIASRLTSLFIPEGSLGRPAHGGDPRFASCEHWKDYPLFYEYFDGDTGRGLGASHQTGWTSLVIRLLEKQARERLETNGH